MKAFILMVAVSALVAACVVADEPEPAKKGERWEYAELHIREGAKVNYVKFVTSKATTEAPDWEGLAAKLKAPAAVKSATEVTHRLRVMDALGEQGWELVLYRANAANLTDVSTLKRRIPAK